MSPLEARLAALDVVDEIEEKCVSSYWDGYGHVSHFDRDKAGEIIVHLIMKLEAPDGE